MNHDTAFQRACFLEAMSLMALLVGLVSGCGERIPPDPYAEIVMCERPNEIDTTRIGEFEVLFDNVDPRTEVPTVQSGAKLHVTGALLLKPEMQTPGDGLDLIIGYRPINDGAADWSVRPCDVPGRVEWHTGNRTSRQGGVLISTLDGSPTVQMEPGEYELRFYAISENVVTEELPTVYYIADGRLRVTSPENEHASGE